MQNELKILGHRPSPWHGHCKKSLNVTYILAEVQYVAQNIAGVIEKEKDSPRKIKLYPTLMLGLCIVLSFFDMAVAISFELGEFSFMWTGHDQRACHSPWMEPVFRATDSHNHTNPHKPPSAWALCCQGHRLPQKKKNNLEGPGRAATIGVRTDMKGRFFVLSDIYLAEAEQEKRCDHKDRSPRSTVWY